MNWTKEKPSKPGYYWVYTIDNSKELCKVDNFEIKEKIALGYNDTIHCFSNIKLFMGPIEEPKEPK